MAARPETATVVSDVLEALWPGRFDEGRLRDDVSLGEGGLGLDSIDIVELVLACEERVGRPSYGANHLLEAGPVTIGRLVDHLAAA